jgi:hypothetical protein
MPRLLNDCLLCCLKINFLSASMKLIKNLKNDAATKLSTAARKRDKTSTTTHVERTRDKTSHVTLRPSMQQVIVSRLPISNTSQLAITLGSRIRRVYPPSHWLVESTAPIRRPTG